MSRFVLCASSCGTIRISCNGGKITSVVLLRTRPGGAPDITKSMRQAPDFQTALDALKSYFVAGQNPFIPVRRFAFDGLTAFTRSVILGTRRVPMGRTVTYTEFARMLKLPPGSRRAVGGALGRNPFPLFFPCHRIVGGNGLGGFSSGIDWKRRLLAHEGASVK